MRSDTEGGNPPVVATGLVIASTDVPPTEERPPMRPRPKSTALTILTVITIAASVAWASTAVLVLIFPNSSAWKWSALAALMLLAAAVVVAFRPGRPGRPTRRDGD